MSKTSYFNKTVFRKNLTRFFPLWFLYTVLILLMGPVQAMQAASPFQAGQNLLNIYGIYAALELVHGFVTAFLLFAYLFSARSANMYHSFPVRRETYFFTNVLSGLLFSWGPNALAAVVCAVFSQAEPAVAGIWFLMRGMEYFLGFSVAVLAIHCAGNFIGAGLLTLVLHAGVPMGEFLARYILTPLLYGMPKVNGPWTQKISPTFWLVQNEILRYNEWYFNHKVSSEESLCSCITVGWGRLGIVAACGVVCLALALVLYQRRPMEAAGDIVAFPKFRPVFKYLFALGCALGFGGALLDIVFPNLLSGSNWIPNPWKILLCLPAAGAAGYFAAEMLLEKSVRVFRPKYLARCAGVVVFLCACVLAVHLDPAKIQEKVPDWREVESVRMYATTDESVVDITDEETIREITALHQIFLDNRVEIQNRIDNRSGYRNMPYETGETLSCTVDMEAVSYYDYSTVTISYTLRDGGTLTRRYRLFTATDLEDIENLGQRLNTILNRPDYMEARFFAYSDLMGASDPWGELREGASSAWVQFYTETGTTQAHDLTAPEARALVDALRADMEAGTLHGAVTSAFVPSAVTENLGEAVVNYGGMEMADGTVRSSALHIDLGAKGENTLAYLESLGIRPGEA